MSIMRNRELREVIDEWEREVEAEMVRLIRQGTPPYDAGVRARNIVTERRRSKTPESR